MNFTEILLIAFGVSIDAAAVTVSGSICPGRYSKWHCAINAALFFGIFQFFMPLIGFYAAGIFTGILSCVDHYIAFLLLLFVGGKMLYEALNKKAEGKTCPLREFFSAKNLFLPAIATSIDALAIGAGLAFSGKSICLPAISMGVVTAVISALCAIIGKNLANSRIINEEKFTAAGGVIIILIGIKILLQDIGVLPSF